MTSAQIAQGWFHSAENPTRCAEQAIARLERAELITRRTLEAHPIQDLTRPLFAWKPGMPDPSERRLAGLAKSTRGRWSQNHLPAEVLFATRRASALFGAFTDARNPQHFEATHDLHLTEVYLRYRRKHPQLAACWLGEAAFPKLGFVIPRMKDPDVFLIDRQGRAKRIIEFAGSYDAEHLRAFHEHCAGGAAARLADNGWNESDNPFARLYQPAGTSYELW
ncbi:MAG: hypothetical protein HY290_04305 [Planctomycetia bacterium]|nr:hypothetical protein [Planctomycetia bacterium]